MIPEDDARVTKSLLTKGVVDIDAKRSLVSRTVKSDNELANLVAASRQIAGMAEPTKLTADELETR